MNNPKLYLRKLPEKEQKRPRENIGNKIIQIKKKINEIENRKKSQVNRAGPLKT